MSIIASNIARIIDEKGLKQKYVADKVGITEQTLSNYLSCRSGIRADLIPAFCKALEVDPNALYCPVEEAAS